MKKKKIVLMILIIVSISIIMVSFLNRETTEGSGKIDSKLQEEKLRINKEILEYIGKTPEEMLEIFESYTSLGGFQGAYWFEYGNYSVVYDNTWEEEPTGKVMLIGVFLEDFVVGMKKAFSVEKLDSLLKKTGELDSWEEEGDNNLQYSIEYEFEGFIITILLGQNKSFVEPKSSLTITQIY